jgi:opacity protein-like surface antigen
MRWRGSERTAKSGDVTILLIATGCFPAPLITAPALPHLVSQRPDYLFGFLFPNGKPMKTLKTAAFALATIPFAAMSPALAGNLDAAVVSPAPVMAAAPAAYTSIWSGGYAGAQLGYGWADRSVGDEATVIERFTNPTDTAEAVGNRINSVGADGDGLTGGVHAGYLWNANRFVYGLEGDYDFSDIELDNNVGSVDGIARIKAKAGYDLGQTLIYATAGAAYADAEIGNTNFNDWGWVAGAGVDYMVAENVALGVEALYHDFSEFDDSGTDLSLTTLSAKVAYHF